jgi:hypothetical protein
MRGYSAAAVPTAGLRGWISRELRKIADILNAPIILKPLAAEPDRFSDGMIVYANGADWNPGAGAGFYGREAGAWVKL